MKNLILLTSALLSFQAVATEIHSDAKTAQVDIGRVDQLIPLVRKGELENTGLRVSVVVKDLGGSTDVSPTREVFFTIYLKGEMFSTDASFYLAPVFSVKSAKRISGGRYQIVVSIPNDAGGPMEKVFWIDATKALKEIQSVRCEDFDCPASRDFKSSIEVIESLGVK